MKNSRRIITCIIFIFLGIVLVGLGFTEVSDPFWSGMGGALIAVGIIRIARFSRYQRDEAYREKAELEKTDERLRFLRSTAWAWAGYLFILIAAFSSIIFKLFGQDLLSVAAGSAVCILVLLYWICHLILSKKY